MIRAACMLFAVYALAACSSAPARDLPGPTLRVVTLSLYHDRADWPARLPLIVEQLRALDADVIALQEVLQTDALPNQADTLAEALGYSAEFVSLDDPGQARRYGNALLTRLPVQARDAKHLVPHDDGRSLGWARVEFQGRPVDVYFTHLHSDQRGGAVRQRQLEDALAWIGQTGGDAPVLLLGDFNAPAGAPELRVLDGFVDTYAERHPGADADPAATTTLNPHFFPELRGRIDRIFAQAGRFDVIDARIVVDTPDAHGTWPSDHFGVYAELQPRGMGTAR